MYRNNWRRAARYMYHYSYRLKQEIKLNENRQVSSTFQEILCALSATINALQLVHPPHAWIDTHVNFDKSSPNKRPRQVFTKNGKPIKKEGVVFIFLSLICFYFFSFSFNLRRNGRLQIRMCSFVN